jgi:DNA-(apurinic or apyrimidinic site) lyase
LNFWIDMELLEILKEFTLKDAIAVEKIDRQYKALERLYRALEDKELFFKLVLVNALLSYQLPTKGENYWENFARYFSEHPELEKFEDFLKKYNNRFLSSKLRRLQKVLRAIKPLTLKDFAQFCKNPERLLNYLSRKLNQDRESKTLVFTVKMFIYACRVVTGKDIIAPHTVFIPLDVRLKKISPEREFWLKLGKEIGIPLLHLDAVIWVTMGAKEEFLKRIEDTNLSDKLLRLKKVLKGITKK